MWWLCASKVIRDAYELMYSKLACAHKTNNLFAQKNGLVCRISKNTFEVVCRQRSFIVLDISLKMTMIVHD